MAFDRNHLRILAESESIRALIAATLQTIAEAKELLSEPAPSSFLGRKTQEPFPPEGPALLPELTGENRYAASEVSSPSARVPGAGPYDGS